MKTYKQLVESVGTPKTPNHGDLTRLKEALFRRRPGLKEDDAGKAKNDDTKKDDPKPDPDDTSKKKDGEDKETFEPQKKTVNGDKPEKITIQEAAALLMEYSQFTKQRQDDVKSMVDSGEFIQLGKKHYEHEKSGIQIKFDVNRSKWYVGSETGSSFRGGFPTLSAAVLTVRQMVKDS